MVQITATVVATFLAVVLVYPLNRFTQEHAGTKTLLLRSPLWEEAAKVLFAYITHGGLFAVHLLFGLVEAISDWYGGEKNKWHDAFSSLVSHIIFGLLGCLGIGSVRGMSLAVFVQPVQSWSELLAAWSFAVTVHWLWNYRVARTLKHLL